MAAANSKKTAPGRPFKAGQSGNPKGRPKQTDAEKEALEILRAATPDAARTLIALLGVRNEEGQVVLTKDSLGASLAILERTLGKTAAAKEDRDAVSGRPEWLDTLTRAEVIRLARGEKIE